MASNQFIAVCSTVCSKAAIPLTRSSANQLVQLEKSWVSTTRTAINRFTTPWFAWLKSSHCAIHSSMAKGTSVRLTATHLQQCDTPNPDSTESQSTCLKTSKRRRSISNRISMIPNRNRQFCQPVYQTFCSMEATVLRLVWQHESLLITSPRLLVRFTCTCLESSHKAMEISPCLKFRFKSTWSTSRAQISQPVRPFTALTVLSTCTRTAKDASTSAHAVKCLMTAKAKRSSLPKSHTRSRKRTCLSTLQTLSTRGLSSEFVTFVMNPQRKESVL